MDPTQVQALVGRYHKAIGTLDSQTDRLDESQQKQYEQQKERFVAQIHSWQKASEREFEQMQSNLEESFNELESVWYHARRH
jgi:uncharacterized protein YukE